MEYYSALKSTEILVHITAWMNHEDIMLNEITRHKRTNIVCILYKGPRIIKFIKTESRRVVTMGSERYSLIGSGWQCGMMKKSWGWMLLTQQCECTYCHWTVHFKTVEMVSFMYILYAHTNICRGMSSFCPFAPFFPLCR